MTTTHARTTPHSPRHQAVYGSFHLHDCEYAIAAEHIQEVVNYDGGCARIPRSQDFIEGWYNLRGTILPVLDLKKMFRPEMAGDEPPRKLAIVNVGQLTVGLLFDATGEIIRSNGENTRNLDPEHAEGKLVTGAIETQAGRRIVQILNLPTLVRVGELPHLVSSAANGDPKQVPQPGRSRGSAKRCITFLMGHTHYGIDIGGVKEIAEFSSFLEVGIAAESSTYLGVIDLRGRKVPIVDLRAVLGIEAPAFSLQDPKRGIVIEIEGAAVGLYVDSLENISTYHTGQLLQLPGTAPGQKAESNGLVVGCLSDPGDNHTLLLDVPALGSMPSIRDTALSLDRLFNSETTATQKRNKAGRKDTQAYVCFEMESLFGVSIGDVQEIINFPEKLLTAPSANHLVSGILKLRNEVLYVFNLKPLFGYAPQAGGVSQQIIIVSRNGVKFGLTVDAVRSLVCVPKKDKIIVPRHILGTGLSGYGGIIQEVILAREDGNESDIQLILLNLDALTQHVMQPN